jgi:hypothetical protein
MARGTGVEHVVGDPRPAVDFSYQRACGVLTRTREDANSGSSAAPDR